MWLEVVTQFYIIFFQITSGYIFISMRRIEQNVIIVLDYLTIVIINSSMKIMHMNVEQ